MRQINLYDATRTEVKFSYSGQTHTMRYAAVQALVDTVDRYMTRHSMIANVLTMARGLNFRCVCDMAEKLGFSNQGQVYMVLRYLASEGGPLDKDGHRYYDAEDFSQGGFVEAALEDIWTAQSKNDRRRRRAA